MTRRALILAAFAFSPVLPVAAQAPLASFQPDDPVDRLGRYLRVLSTAPRDLEALTGAGRAALDVGDANAAIGFFARAEEVAPRDGRVKAGLAAALVQMEQPREALKLFDQAIDHGVPLAAIAADRGLAYDLRGDNRRAQADYAVALRAAPNDETARRLALSQAMSGDRAGALATLDPLLRRQDKAAWRASTFVMALTGDAGGAVQRLGLLVPAGQAAQIAPFLGRLAALKPAQQALAVHFGRLPSDGRADTGTALAANAATPGTAAAPSPTRYADAFAATRQADPSSRAERRRPGQEAAVAATPMPGFSAAAGPLPGAVVRRSVVSVETRPPVRVAALAPVRPSLPPPVEVATTTSPASGDAAAGVVPQPAAASPATVEPVAARVPVATPIAAATVVPVPTAAADVPTQASVASSLVAAPGARVPDAAAVAPPTEGVPMSVGGAAVASFAAPLPAPAAVGAPVETAPPPASAPPVQIAMIDLPPSSAAVPAAPAPPVRAPRAAPEMPAATPVVAPKPRAVRDGDVAVAKAGQKPAASAAAVAKPVPREAAKDGSKPRKVQLAQLDADVPAAKGKAKAALDDLPAKPTAAEKAATAKAAKEAKAKKDARAAADAKKAKADADADAKAAAAKAKAVPERHWVQVAGGANKADLPKAWGKVKAQYPQLMAGKSAWTTPLRFTNRLLVGPFKSADEAQAFVNANAKAGFTTSRFTSPAGQAVERLGGK